MSITLHMTKIEAVPNNKNNHIFGVISAADCDPEHSF